MAYDEALAERVRDALCAHPDLTERKMFGGLGFMLSGHMAVTASGQGGLMVRVAVNEADALFAEDGVNPVEMRGREMRGWLRVDNDALTADDALEAWVGRGVAFVRSLPPK